MSNTRKVTHYCEQPDCHRQASVQATIFNDERTQSKTYSLCHKHAAEHVQHFKGKIWGDANCQCGNIDHLIEQAGRSKDGNL